MRRICLLSFIMLCGCLTKAEYIPVTIYVVEPQPQVGKAATIDKTLGVRPFDAARPYRQHVVYRDKGMVLGYLDNVEWAELPGQLVARELIDALVETGRFRDVGYAGDMHAPDYMLTGELRRFDLNRTGSRWTADVEVRMELRGALSPDALWSGTLFASQELDQNDVAALPGAMSGALATVIGEAVKAITKP